MANPVLSESDGLSELIEVCIPFQLEIQYIRHLVETYDQDNSETDLVLYRALELCDDLKSRVKLVLLEYIDTGKAVQAWRLLMGFYEDIRSINGSIKTLVAICG